MEHQPHARASGTKRSAPRDSETEHRDAIDTRNATTPTILLVDDEQAYRNAVKRVLADDQHRFLEAASGEEALALLESNTVSLVLLDLVMPCMDGFAFLEIFRNNGNWRPIPVCVMTAWSDGAKRRRAIELGADDFIGKPVDNIELETRIKSLLRMSRYQSELRDMNAQLEAKVRERTQHLQASLDELKQAWEESTRDALTGVFNRRFMWEWLLPQLKHAKRHKVPLSCLMIDIDRFKDLNDAYGHHVGDEVLKHFSDIIAKNLRESDIVVRYGGEEFVTLLPNCNLENGRLAAERIRQAVTKMQLSSLKGTPLTCSIGVAVYDPAEPTTGEELLKQADKALYKAKNAGRNRVV